VLGTEIVRYDIYGADVMIANKMESNGLKGQVQVSEETKMLLESAYPYDFMYEFNKTIEFTAIGRKTNGYFIYPANNEVEVESISGRVLHSHE
jgi:class 3 adenylate cyclase